MSSALLLALLSFILVATVASDTTKGFFEWNARFTVTSWNTKTRPATALYTIYADKKRFRIDSPGSDTAISMLADFELKKIWYFANASCVFIPIEAGQSPFDYSHTFEKATQLAPSTVNNRAVRAYGDVQQKLIDLRNEILLSQAQYAVDFWSGEPVQFWDTNTAFVINNQEDLSVETLDRMTTVSGETDRFCYKESADNIANPSMAFIKKIFQ